MARSPLLPIRGRGKYLRVWVRLLCMGVNRPHVKRGTYHANGLWVLTYLYGDIMSLWHFCLCGSLWHRLAFQVLGTMLLCSQYIYYVVSWLSFLRSFGWNYLIILIILSMKIILQFSARNSQIVSCCNMHIIMKLAFLLPPLIMLLIGVCLISFFHKLFLSRQRSFWDGFLWLAVIRQTTNGG